MSCPDQSFIGFIRNCLIWDPEKRMTPETAKIHPWILSGYNGSKPGLTRNKEIFARTKQTFDTNRSQDGNISTRGVKIYNSHKKFDMSKTLRDNDGLKKSVLNNPYKIILKDTRNKKNMQKSFENIEKRNLKIPNKHSLIPEKLVKLITPRTNRQKTGLLKLLV